MTPDSHGQATLRTAATIDGFGPVVQTAWVVADIAAAEARASDRYGVGAWTRLPDIAFGPQTCTLRGEPADYTAHVSLAYLDDMQLELIEPRRGASLYREFLDARGSGLHHLAVEPPDFDAAVAGADLLARGVVGGMEYAYLVAPAGTGVPCLELLRLDGPMRAFFAQVRQRSAVPPRPTRATDPLPSPGDAP